MCLYRRINVGTLGNHDALAGDRGHPARTKLALDAVAVGERRSERLQ